MKKDSGDGYDNLSYKDLQQLCKKRGIPARAKEIVLRQALRDYDSGKIINSDLSYSRARLVPDVPSPAQDYSPPKVKQAEKLQRASSSLISYDEDEEDALSSGSSSEDYSSSSDEAPKRTPVKITPSKSTPVKITPSRVTPSRTTPSRTPPSKTPPSSTPRRTPERKPPSSINSTADQLPSYLKIVLGALVASALLFIFQDYLGSAPQAVNGPQLPAIGYPLKELRKNLGSEPSYTKQIIQTFKIHEGNNALLLFLVGPTEEGRKVADVICSTLHSKDKDMILELKGNKEDVMMEKISSQLSKHPNSTIVIDMTGLDKDNSNFLNLFLDDTMPQFEWGGHKGLSAQQAVFILLADYLPPNTDTESIEIHSHLRKHLADRVAQRIRNIVVL